MSRLDGKVALITGATGGIGEATVRLFLEEGARVMLVDRSADKLQTLSGSLPYGERVATSVADARDEEATKKAFENASRQFGGLDIVFANAGYEGTARRLQKYSAAEFEEVWRTNVVGVWLALKYGVTHLLQRGGGSMIATSSMAGLVGFSGLSPYVASKHAVCGLVKTAALEFGAKNIRVNAIAPGPIDNRMMRSVESKFSPEDPDKIRSGVIGQIALGRYGSNEEVARLALFLGGEESTYCTGGVYTVDGGFTAA